MQGAAHLQELDHVELFSGRPLVPCQKKGETEAGTRENGMERLCPSWVFWERAKTSETGRINATTRPYAPFEPLCRPLASLGSKNQPNHQQLPNSSSTRLSASSTLPAR